MLRSITRVTTPLVNRQSTRGLTVPASIKDLRVSHVTSALRKYAPELAPPTPAEIPRALRELRGIFKDWQQWTVREGCLKALVATEVVCWFFVGECIGKGTLIGYQV